MSRRTSQIAAAIAALLIILGGAAPIIAVPVASTHLMASAAPVLA